MSICVCTYICLCVCVYMSMYVYTCLCVCMCFCLWIHVQWRMENNLRCLLQEHLLWDKAWHWPWTHQFRLAWLTRELQGSSLCLWGDAITSVLLHPCIFTCVLGTRFRPLNLQGKHFINWTISLAPLSHLHSPKAGWLSAYLNNTNYTSSSF